MDWSAPLGIREIQENLPWVIEKVVEEVVDWDCLWMVAVSCFGWFVLVIDTELLLEVLMAMVVEFWTDLTAVMNGMMSQRVC